MNGYVCTPRFLQVIIVNIIYNTNNVHMFKIQGFYKQ